MRRIIAYRGKSEKHKIRNFGGKIVSEPKQIGLGFTVKVQWVGVPYDDSLGGYWLEYFWLVSKLTYRHGRRHG